MRWKLHTLQIDGKSNNTMIEQRWLEAFDPLPAGSNPPDLTVNLALADSMPKRPPGNPDFNQAELLQYFLDGDQVIVFFPRYGRLKLDLEKGTTEGIIIKAALESYGVFEDLLAISLSPHLRRRGLFLIHAFAASFQGQGLLIVGGIGAGKTTTGMALLDSGWKLLSNDSPIINQEAKVLQYPGVLAAYSETYERFKSTKEFIPPSWNSKEKICLSPTKVWPDVWRATAPVRIILFPQIEQRKNHALEALTAPETLQRLLPHAVEQWDKAMIPQHLMVLRKLAEAARGYIFRLGPDVLGIPEKLEKELF